MEPIFRFTCLVLKYYWSHNSPNQQQQLSGLESFNSYPWILRVYHDLLFIGILRRWDLVKMTRLLLVWWRIKYHRASNWLLTWSLHWSQFISSLTSQVHWNGCFAFKLQFLVGDQFNSFRFVQFQTNGRECLVSFVCEGDGLTESLLTNLNWTLKFHGSASLQFWSLLFLQSAYMTVLAVRTDDQSQVPEKSQCKRKRRDNTSVILQVQKWRIQYH